ncbi:unnamed protein product [Symbiodinium sp. CCMP2456]|nr:unnamed protein product [Symbiodinium sp. CCMP2456]
MFVHFSICDSQPDSRLNTVALLIQSSWRRSSRRRECKACARDFEQHSDILPAFEEATPGGKADGARARVEGGSGTSAVLPPARLNESCCSPTTDGIDALPAQHAGSGPPEHPSEEHHPGRYDAESKPECTVADHAPGFRAQVIDMTSASSKLDLQTDADEAGSCAPSLPSMISEWQVIDDRQRLERFLLPAEDVGAFGYKVLPDWSDPDGKCSTSFEKTVQQWLSERLKDKLRKDCQRIAISIKDKHGQVAPSKLTDGELFVLVAYALDVRKKHSGLSWDMNFSSRLSRVVRRQPDSIDKEMSTCLRFFNDALDKSALGVLQVGQVYLPTFSSWTPSAEIASRAAGADGGLVRVTAKASDLSEIREACGEEGGEFVLQPNCRFSVVGAMAAAGNVAGRLMALELMEANAEDEHDF